MCDTYDETAIWFDFCLDSPKKERKKLQPFAFGMGLPCQTFDAECLAKYERDHAEWC